MEWCGDSASFTHDSSIPVFQYSKLETARGVESPKDNGQRNELSPASQVNGFDDLFQRRIFDVDVFDGKVGKQV